MGVPGRGARARRFGLARALPAVVVALVVGTVAFFNGGYGLSSRALLAVLLWWTIMLGLAFGIFPRRAVPRTAAIAAASFAAFAVWTLASMSWATDAESAFTEFNRHTLYLAVLLLAIDGAVRRHGGRWADGLYAGIVATALIALVSRLLPDLVSNRELESYIPSAATRLSFPVGYWNALGILVSLGFPLGLRAAMVARRRSLRALAVGLGPALAATVYLTSSRGAIATALVGTALFLLATDRRWSALGVAGAVAAGSALAVGVLLQRGTLVNGPLESELAAGQGRSALALILVACLVSSGLLIAGESVLSGRFRPRRLVGWAVTAVVVCAVVAVFVRADPAGRFDAFKQLPQAGSAQTDFTATHLLSGSGSGRWQFWSAALDEFRSAPLHGGGAGSFESWWAQHGSFSYFLKNAHSLYLEVLGELGLVGLVLLLFAFACGLAGAFGLRELRGPERVTGAAVTAVLVAFMAGAAIDWIWQITVVGAVGIAALGLSAGSAAPRGFHSGDADPLGTGRSRLAVGAAALAAVWALFCAQAIPWLAAAKVSDSQAAVRAGDTDAALKHALDAKSLQPWAASPYVQLALVAEERGDLSGARRWISGATRRDSADWRVWFIAARIERRSGLFDAAARSLATAKSLNPRSPLFASTG